MRSKNKETEKKKSCFIITPIGAGDSTTRRRVDQWTKFIYEPVFGHIFNIIRADRISTPGIITKQILELIIESELVIIDYTEMNPNVMYEAAIRHIARKPFIQICPENENLPFDIHNLRAIRYDSYDLEYPIKLVKLLKDTFKSIQDPSFKIPEVLPIEFDFKKIISDPEEFIDLLKKHLVYDTGGGMVTYRENISEVYDNVGYLGEMLPESVSCPKCGTIQKFYRSPYILSTTSSNTKHYKCNVCDNEFIKI